MDNKTFSLKQFKTIGLTDYIFADDTKVEGGVCELTSDGRKVQNPGNDLLIFLYC